MNKLILFAAIMGMAGCASIHPHKKTIPLFGEMTEANYKHQRVYLADADGIDKLISFVQVMLEKEKDNGGLTDHEIVQAFEKFMDENP